MFHVFVAQLRADAPHRLPDEWATAARNLKMDGLKRVVAGRGLADPATEWDVAIMAELDDVEAYHHYAKHPDHHALVNSYRIPWATGFARLQIDSEMSPSYTAVRSLTLIKGAASNGTAIAQTLRKHFTRQSGRNFAWRVAEDLNLVEGNASLVLVRDYVDIAAWRLHRSDPWLETLIAGDTVASAAQVSFLL